MSTTAQDTTGATTPLRELTRPDLRKRLAAIGIGNFLEWFDFAIYGYFAAIIGAQFFPTGNPATELLSSLAVFAVGFLARPLGAVLLGPIGDRHGRRTVLVITVLGMGVATALIGLTPPFAVWGVAAPITVIALRFVQGMMVGGEWSAAATYLGESAPQRKRGLYAALITCTAGFAFLVGTGVATLISLTLTPEQAASWGWRLPFIASVVMALLALWIRWRLGETPVYEEVARRRETQTLERVSGATRVRTFLLALAFSGVFGITLYYFITYTANYLGGVVGMPRELALTAVSIGLVAHVIANPIVGAIADRVGRRPVMLVGALGVVVLAIPIFALLSTGVFASAVFAAILLGVLASICGTVNVVLLVEVFPASIRSAGAAIGYNVAAALFAGPGPFVAAALVAATGNLISPAYYLGAVALLCLAILWFLLPETRNRNIADG